MAAEQKYLTVNQNPKDNVYYVTYNSTSFYDAYQAYYDYGNELVLKYTNAQNMNFVMKASFTDSYLSSSYSYRCFNFVGFLANFELVYMATCWLEENGGWSTVTVKILTSGEKIANITSANYGRSDSRSSLLATANYLNDYCRPQTLAYDNKLTFSNGAIIKTSTGGTSAWTMTLDTFAQYFLKSMGAYPLNFSTLSQANKYILLRKFAPCISFYIYGESSLSLSSRTPAYFSCTNTSMTVQVAAAQTYWAVQASGSSVTIKLS